MKGISKLKGLQLLQEMGLPTVQFYANCLPTTQEFYDKERWSLRLSQEYIVCENLSSWHTIKDYRELQALYVESVSKGFHTIIHQTVAPIYIGHMMLEKENGFGMLVIEFYADFIERKKGISCAGYYIPIIGDHYFFSESRRIGMDSFLVSICSRLIDISYNLEYSDVMIEFTYDTQLLFTDCHTTVAV